MDKQSNGHPEPPTDEYPPDPPEVCRYCRSPVHLVSAEKVFPGTNLSANLYFCEGCGARVGVHEGTGEPVGYLADAELRRWRRVLHQALDPLRREARWYPEPVHELIQDALDVPEERAHVAMLSIREIKNMIVWLMRKGPELS
jgi:hypothetical protein